MTYEEMLIEFQLMTQEFDDEEDVKSFGLLIDAIKKQIPRKPIEKFAFSDDIEAGLCPSCNEGVNEEMNFCSYCGQAIDWGESK